MLDLSYLPWIPLLPLIGFVVNGLFGRLFMRTDRRIVHYIACGTLGASLVLSVAALLAITGAAPSLQDDARDLEAQATDLREQAEEVRADDLAAAEAELAEATEDEDEDDIAEAQARIADVQAEITRLLELATTLDDEAAAKRIEARDLAEGGVTAHAKLYTWIATSEFAFDLGFYVDGLTVIMLLVVTGVGLLIHVYSIGYMHGDPGYARFFAFMNLFCFAMLTLVMADNLVLLFVGWEGVGLCSYLLIGYWFEDPAKAKAGMKAFVVNRIGDLGFLLGMFLLFGLIGTLSIPEINAAAASGALAGHGALIAIVCLLLFIGATGKSAQIPLFVWLPDAMAGPTPVSALIHAATMVTAGVFMIARLGPLFGLVASTGAVIAIVGALTALMAATIAVTQHDIKKVLAYSTVSQLGFMFIAAGAGAYGAAIFHLTTHAFFKALLFLGAGAVIHGMAHAYPEEDPDFHQDIRNMGGIRHAMPRTFWTFLIGAGALAGLAPLAGFWSKDEILHRALHGGGWFLVAALIGFIAAAFTAFYSARLVILTFFGEHKAGRERLGHVHEAPKVMTVPLLVLAILAAIGGLLNWPGDHDSSLGPHAISSFMEVPQAKFALEHAAAGHAADAISHVAEEVPEPGFGATLVGERVLSSGEWIGWLVSMAIAYGFAYFGWVMYTRRRELLAKLTAEGPLKGVYPVVHEKYRVDEIYDRYVIKPVYLVSWAIFAFIDRVLIDYLLVDAMGGLVLYLSRKARKLQTGFLRNYAFALALGVMFVLGIMFVLVWQVIFKF